MRARPLLAGLLAVLVPLGGSGAAASVTTPGSTPRGSPARLAVTAVPAAVEYAAPMPAPLVVLRGFDPPADPYGPGHVGVDLRATDGALVRAAADGVVRFAGQVAGRGLVVIVHPDGISTEYEPLHPHVRAGERVRRGEPVGVRRGRHRGCAVSCLHWGAKRAGRYLDPLSLLRPLGPVVLLPWSRPG